MKLTHREYTILLVGRYTLWLAFAIISFVAFFLVFFPNQKTLYDFETNKTLKTLPDQGVVRRELTSPNVIASSEDRAFLLQTSDRFSQLSLSLKTKEKISLGSLLVRAQKGYAATLSAVGTPATLPVGSLVKRNNTLYFVADNGILYPFDSPETARALGWEPESFLDIDKEERKSYSKASQKITLEQGYPEGALLAINDRFYRFIKGKLSPFISEAAYLSSYPKEFAAVVSPEAQKSLIFSDDPTGFVNNTLLSYNDAVYVIDGSNAYPIADPQTFASFGWQWNRVIATNSEEIGMYKKSRQLTILDTHPSQTVFRERDSKKMFLFSDNRMHPITGTQAQAFFARRNIVEITPPRESSVVCEKSTRSFLNTHVHNCKGNIESLNQDIGNTYKIFIQPDKDVVMRSLTLTLHQDASWDRLLFMLSSLKQTASER